MFGRSGKHTAPQVRMDVTAQPPCWGEGLPRDRGTPVIVLLNFSPLKFQEESI